MNSDRYFHLIGNINSNQFKEMEMQYIGISFVCFIHII